MLLPSQEQLAKAKRVGMGIGVVLGYLVMCAALMVAVCAGIVRVAGIIAAGCQGKKY